MVVNWAEDALRESKGVLSELLWPAFAHPYADCLGISPRALLRAHPMGAKFTFECAGEGCDFWNLSLYEWNDIRDPRVRRCYTNVRAGTIPRLCRGWLWLWLTRPDYWLYPGDLPGVFTPGDQYLAARCARRLTFKRDRIVA